MVTYSWSRSKLEQACLTALELVESITSIPVEYLKTMSLAMASMASYVLSISVALM